MKDLSSIDMSIYKKMSMHQSQQLESLSCSQVQAVANIFQTINNLFISAQMYVTYASRNIPDSVYSVLKNLTPLILDRTKNTIVDLQI